MPGDTKLDMAIPTGLLEMMFWEGNSLALPTCSIFVWLCKTNIENKKLKEGLQNAASQLRVEMGRHGREEYPDTSR